MTKSKQTLVTLAGTLAVLGSFLSYTHAGLVPITIAGYGMALVGLGLAFLVIGRFPRSLTQRIVPFTMLFTAATIASGFSVAGAEVFGLRLVQELFYPVGAFLILLTGFHILRQSGPILGWCILGLGMANLAVGISGVAGVLGSAGPFGPVEQGRFIFGTTLRSSNGLMLNVNYFAVTQATLGFMYALYRHTRTGSLSRQDILFSGMLVASSVIGSSRGVTVSILAVAAFFLIALAFQSRGKSKSLFRALLLAAIASFWIAGALYWPEIEDIFRFNRGLNQRDEIWATVILAWLERPLFGWSTETSAAMGFASAGEFAGTSAHSGYLHMLLSGGLVSFIVIYGFILYCLVWSSSRLSPSFAVLLVPLGCVMFYLVNSLFRTYSFGGVGLLGVLGLLGLSVCLYHRNAGVVAAQNRPRFAPGVLPRYLGHFKNAP